jgi:tetratricopeptide (TPR) repeat protein
LIAALTLLALAPAASSVELAGPLEEARGRMQRFNEGMQAMQAAWDAGRQADAIRRRDEARRHAREAIELYLAAGAAAAEDPELLDEFTQACAATGDWDLAGEALERAVVRTPDDAARWADLAEAWLRTGPGRHEDALNAIGRAFALSPGPETAARAHRLRAGRDWELGLYPAAREDYEQAVALNATDTRAVIGLAAARARDGEMAEASAAFFEIGAQAEVYDVLIRRQLRDALHDFNELRGVVTGGAEAHSAYGHLLYRAARIPDALLALRQAVRLNPGQTDALNLLGGIQMQLGNAPQAIDAYERSLEADPDQAAIRQILEELRAAAKAHHPPDAQ